MRTTTWMRFLAMVLGALGLAACTSTTEAFTPPEWLGKETLPAREQPARVSRQTADELQRQGYVQIGTIHREVVVATHWGTEPAPTERAELTTGLLREAAAVGGDVVVLEADNKLDRRTVTKQIPTAFRQESQQELYQDGNYQRSRTVYTSVPTAWRTESGTEYYIESRGTVWRHDPGLLQRAIAWKQTRDTSDREHEKTVTSGWLDDGPRIASFGEFRKLPQHWGRHFDDVGEFREGLAPFKQRGAWGFLDRSGTIVIPPRYLAAHPFAEGLAFVLREKWGYIDSKGEWLIPPQFGTPEFSFGCAEFSEGLAAVRAADGKVGYIDRSGRFVVEPRYEEGGRFVDGLALVRLQTGIGTSVCGFIDRSGAVRIPFEYQGVHRSGDGLAPAWKEISMTTERTVGFLDRTGRMAIGPAFDQAEPFHEQRAAVRIDGKWGYVDPNGTMVVPPQFQAAGPFERGLAVVATYDFPTFANGRHGTVDKDGKVTWWP